MAILTDAEKRKTVAEYLGLTGEIEEIQEKLEKDVDLTKKLENLLSDIFDSSDRIYEYFSGGKSYPFVIGEIGNKSIQEIENNKSSFATALKNQYTEITEDFDNSSKRRDFFIATGYSMSRDKEDERGYFFRFWRSPISKLMKYRGIDPKTDDGKIKAKEILNEVFGPETEKYTDISPLLSETPEHLVEQKDLIRQRYQDLERNRKLEEEVLKIKPLHETFEKLVGVHFSDSSNPDLMAQEAFAQTDAHRILATLLKTREPLDQETFSDTITSTPQQIEHDANSIKEALIQRNDARYLATNPSVTFARFIADRRSDLPMAEDDKNAVLRHALETVIGKDPVDNRAVKKAMNEPCDKLRSEADFIIMDAQKRKSRRRIIMVGLSALAAISVFWAGKSALSSNPREAKPDKAPTTQRPTAPAPTAQGEKTMAASTTSTNMVQRSLNKAATNGVATATQSGMTNNLETATQATTNGVDTAAQPAPPTEIIGKKGNHLIALRWTGYRDIDYHREMKEAHDLVFQTHFDYMNKRIQSTGLPFADLFKPEHTRQALKKVHNYVWLKPDGKEEVRFYIRADGRTRDAILEDVLSFYMNCRDVLQSLPVSEENLPIAQSKVMTALGPSMGLSAKQQLAWQRMHPEESQDASSEIAKYTQQFIQAGNVDTNNVEAVFMETIKAAQLYRSTHPENKALLLSVDDVARSFANLGKEDMKQYSQLEALPLGTEAHKHIEALHQTEHAEEVARQQERYASYSSSPSRSGRGGSGGFPWKTTAAVGVIAYLWGRKKRKGK